ncbi:hypothetical protein ABAC460_03650 [Asticcacaulis sp. AC460]|uniref:hypothetical protein n=1 Tax=Asticcacaulis sp. AC460 TaxID=1282360 RepID=UPI0003C3DA37|nr:hypothetical protein [Asticcacaulis sp. AC460]ESQ92004.1 hypothetical protein ABAC460_03650 [Asticcacaulis sp. AC460]
MRIQTCLRVLSASLILGMTLTGCVTLATLAPAGNYSVKSKYAVTLDRAWSDVSKFPTSGRTPKVRVLTIDGLMLNRLHISDGLTTSEPLVIKPGTRDGKSTPALRGHTNMSLSEQIEFVTQSVTELDYLRVTSSSPKPVTISGVRGVRFELSGKTPDGLNVKGLGQAVSKDGKNYYIVYLAPAEHYYQASLSNVIAVMDSAKLP